MKEVECGWCLGNKLIWNQVEDKYHQCPNCSGTGVTLVDEDYDDELDEDTFIEFNENLHSLEGSDDE